MAPKVFRLNCQPQLYAWGKIGSSSKVAEYAASTPGFQIDEKKPYAELWMGTHPNAPSKLFETGEDLGALLKSNPELSDPKILEAYGDLPFLLKVLSVNMALSIQAHPNKELGKELFRRHPEIYKDPNHKPEMAIALTSFQALCGFRPLPEIRGFLEAYPEFRAVVGEGVAAEFIAAAKKEEEERVKNSAALKVLFNALMRAEASLVAAQLDALVSRISEGQEEEQQAQVNLLVRRLNEQFPRDVGCFCAFVLNFMTLKPGEAIFLGANLPHAYISGDCIECMATSDNVVRAGLTPKLRDVDTLISMLDYIPGPSSDFLLKHSPFPNTSHSTLYQAPVPEFSVVRTALGALQSEVFEGLEGPSILVVTDGRGRIGFEGEEKELLPGLVYFVAAGAKVTVQANDGHPLDCYRAFCNRLP